MCDIKNFKLANKSCNSNIENEDPGSIQLALDEVISKWTSQEDVSSKLDLFKNPLLKDIPQVWTPKKIYGTPESQRKQNFRPLNFDTNSLKEHQKESKFSNSNRNQNLSLGICSFVPDESFAWKDDSLEQNINEIKSKTTTGELALSKDIGFGFDKNIHKQIGNLSNLPKAPDQDVILLKKARENKKVKHYLESNFQHRNDLITPDEKISLNDAYMVNHGTYAQKYNENNLCKYGSVYSETDGQKSETNIGSTHLEISPPPFDKKQSRFERNQGLKIGPVSSYIPGQTSTSENQSPSNKSGAQSRYERDRFRINPNSVRSYSLGKGSLAAKERASQRRGCSITRYSSNKHSFTGSEHNLASWKNTNSSGQKNHMQSAIRDGYESDSSYSNSQVRYRKLDERDGVTDRCRSQTPAEARSSYNHIQNGGDIPHSGLRIPTPEKPKEPKTHYTEGKVNIHYESPVCFEGNKVFISDVELRHRQESQMRKFYEDIEQKKAEQRTKDLENRKHHDNFLPHEKSPVPLNRYEDVNEQFGETSQYSLGRESPYPDRIVVRARYNFQAQSHRELDFKKGDIIYVQNQIDANWYEGERNAVVGIFPITYVEIISRDELDSIARKKRMQEMHFQNMQHPHHLNDSEKSYFREGEAKVKFDFQPESTIELSLIKGDLVNIIRQIDENWYEGRIGSRTGIFPRSYVEVLREPECSQGGGFIPSEGLKPVASPASHSLIKKTSGSLTALTSCSYTNNFNESEIIQSSTMSQTASSTSQFQNVSNYMNVWNMNEHTAKAHRALYDYQPNKEDEVELSEGDIVFVMEKCDDGWYVGTSQRTGVFGTFPGNYVTLVQT